MVYNEYNKKFQEKVPLLDQVKELMENCEANGYLESTLALGPEGIRDDLLDKSCLGDANPTLLLEVVKTYLLTRGTTQ